MSTSAAIRDLKLDESEACARELDAQDPLIKWREQFCIPVRGGRPVAYLCGNSLGLQPRTVRPALDDVLTHWADVAVDGHFEGPFPWYPYHEFLRSAAAHVVGGLPHEVVMMNGLTVNLHLLMASFYRPTRERFRILMEDCAFPSDTYAARTQLAWHGFDPEEGLLVLQPRPGELLLRTDDIESRLQRDGHGIALLLLGAVNYFTGQAFDLRRIVRAAHAQGCIVGVDCAHAAGNIPLDLHGTDVDFAAWCTYKYLNSGPGSVAGAFVHERHAQNTGLPRLGGWWGNDPTCRFRMHLEPRFKPVPSADAWQLSNPPILSMAAVRASLDLFEQVGMASLWTKATRLIAYMGFLLGKLPPGRVRVLTPAEIDARGCQWSLQVPDGARPLQQAMHSQGVVTDFREPDVIRVAPAPFYNGFHDIWRFVQVLSQTHSP